MWFDSVDFNLGDDPLSLHLRQILIIGKSLFFFEVSTDHDALENIEDELTPDENESHKIQSRRFIRILYRDQVHLSGVNAFKHQLVPALGRRDLVEGHCSDEYVVEVIFVLQPLSPRVEALPLSPDMGKEFGPRLTGLVLGMAVKVETLEEVNSKDAPNEVTEERDDRDVQ
jgi:hypothetical protein